MQVGISGVATPPPPLISPTQPIHGAVTLVPGVNLELWACQNPEGVGGAHGKQRQLPAPPTQDTGCGGVGTSPGKGLIRGIGQITG